MLNTLSTSKPINGIQSKNLYLCHNNDLIYYQKIKTIIYYIYIIYFVQIYKLK